LKFYEDSKCDPFVESNKIEGIKEGYVARLPPSSFEEPDDFE
jgi:hypothetical protein